MKFLTLIAVLSLLAGCFNQVDYTLRPRIDQVAPFYSAQVMPRNVDIWLPRQYHSNPQQRFPVIYMHDGQNLFDHADADLGIAWDIDRVAQRMMDKKQIAPAILVAIWNTPERPQEFFPACAVSYVAPIEDATNPCVGNSYLNFIVRELKPYIDRHYRTLPERQHTLMAGSSYGALLSLYAMVEYPEIFGGIAGVSSRWSLLLNYERERFRDYLGDKLPEAGRHRIYFDMGMATLEHGDELFQTQVDKLMQEKGYVPGRDWVTRKIPGAVHSENPWYARADLMLAFLLGQKTNP